MGDDWQNISLFRNHMKSLKEISYDDENKKHMTQSMALAISFDDAIKDYLKAYDCPNETLKSVDAIAEFNKKPVFIEFKNGVLDKKETKIKIPDKMKDSLLVFGDIADCTINYTRESVEFILVYNLDKNPKKPIDFKEEINGHFFRYAKTQNIRFGLGKYKNLYFKDVRTYSADEFEVFLSHYVQ